MSTSKERRLAEALVRTIREFILVQIDIAHKKKDSNKHTFWCRQLDKVGYFDHELAMNKGDMPYDRVEELYHFSNSLHNRSQRERWSA